MTQKWWVKTDGNKGGGRGDISASKVEEEERDKRKEEERTVGESAAFHHPLPPFSSI